MSDVNAPDLYVPLMSFITFVLVTGYAKGAAAALSKGSSSFSPEVVQSVGGFWDAGGAGGGGGVLMMMRAVVVIDR